MSMCLFSAGTGAATPVPRDVSEENRRRMFQAEAELAIQQYKAERLRRVLQDEKEKQTVRSVFRELCK